MGANTQKIKIGLVVMVFIFQNIKASDKENDRVIISEILEKYIESQGGRERLESITSLELIGEMSLESQGIELTVRQKIEAPDKMYVAQELPVIGTSENFLNGSIGWETHPILGERPLDQMEIKDMLKDTNLQRDLNLLNEYKSIRLGAPETIEGIETIHLIMVDEDDRVEHWYFKENGDLFQKIHTVASGPESENESTDRFYDFEMTDGLRLPRTIRYILPSYVAELSITQCLINQEIDPAFFELPEAAFDPDLIFEVPTN